MLYQNISYMKVLFLTVTACLITSCILSPKPFRSVRYHDLGTPEVVNQNGPFVSFSRFAMNGPYKNKMVFRSEHNQLSIEEYHKWAQTPETMLGRYMALAFRGKPENDSVKTYSVNVTVMTFEAEECSKNALLIVDYTIIEPYQGKKKSFSKTFTSKMKNVTPEKLAIGMAEIAANFADQLKQDMMSMGR